MNTVNVQVTGLVSDRVLATAYCSEWVVVPSSAVGTPLMMEIIDKRLKEKQLVRTSISNNIIDALHQSDSVVKDGRAQSTIYDALQSKS